MRIKLLNELKSTLLGKLFHVFTTRSLTNLMTKENMTIYIKGDQQNTGIVRNYGSARTTIVSDHIKWRQTTQCSSAIRRNSGEVSKSSRLALH